MDFLPFTKPTIDEDTINRVVKVLRSGWITTGPNVTDLENELSKYVSDTTKPTSTAKKNNKPYFVKLFTSATGVLEIALKVMGIGPGDEVIVPSMTFVASANVIALCGAKPVLVDVDPHTRNIDLEIIKKAFTKKTKAIMPVHFAGLSVDMDPIYKFAKEKNIRVLEDAAHAIGTKYKNRKIGSFGDMVSFSFHPNKNMTTIEGGALILRNKAEADLVDLHRFHGLKKDNYGNMDVIFPSGKFNMPDVSAAVGLGQLKHLDEFCKKRSQFAKMYFELLKTDDILTLPAYSDPKFLSGDKFDDGHAWHIFSPLINFKKIKISREEFIKEMNADKIGIGVHYPAVHSFTAYKKMGFKAKDFPHSQKIGDNTISLPLFPTMTADNVEYVCKTLKKIIYK